VTPGGFTSTATESVYIAVSFLRAADYGTITVAGSIALVSIFC
jgi:hypothetical protein